MERGIKFHVFFISKVVDNQATFKLCLSIQSIFTSTKGTPVNRMEKNKEIREGFNAISKGFIMPRKAVCCVFAKKREANSVKNKPGCGSKIYISINLKNYNSWHTNFPHNILENGVKF